MSEFHDGLLYRQRDCVDGHDHVDFPWAEIFAHLDGETPDSETDYAKLAQVIHNILQWVLVCPFNAVGQRTISLRVLSLTRAVAPTVERHPGRVRLSRTDKESVARAVAMWREILGGNP